MCKKHKDNDSFKLLYSIDRMKSVSEYASASKNLEKLLNTGMVIGTDIIGFETPLIGSEYDNFKEKLEWILPVLHIHPGSVLRIHAGEFKDSTENVYNTLRAIKEVSKNINESCVNIFGEEWGILPPPMIRIGHGINIEKKPELIQLLKEFDAVVEFNISSNYALGHVDDLNNLPIKYYDDNDIKYVFATDGGGMYITSLLQEQNLVDNIQITKPHPAKQQIPSNYLEKASKTEKQIKDNSSRLSSEPSSKDKALFDKYMEQKRENGVVEKKHKSYTEAMADEDSLFEIGGTKVSEVDKINIEILRI